MKPTVSACIPVYNGIGYVERALESVLAQTVQPDEILVLDDGSTDETAEVVSKYPVRLVRQVNAGIAAARRRIVELAACEWIAFLDHDDYWLPEKLERTIPRIETGVVLVYNDRWNEFPGGERRMVGRRVPQSAPSLDHVLPENLITTPSVLFDRARMLEVGNFELSPALLEDWLGWLKLLQKGELRYVPERLTIVTMRAGSISAPNRRWHLCERAVLQDFVLPHLETWYPWLQPFELSRYRRRIMRHLGGIASKIGRTLDSEGDLRAAAQEHVLALRHAPLAKGTWYGWLCHMLALGRKRGRPPTP